MIFTVKNILLSTAFKFRSTKKNSGNTHKFNVSASFEKSARRDSNPRPRPWQGRAPPTEPLAHMSVSLRTYKNIPYILFLVNYFVLALSKVVLSRSQSGLLFCQRSFSLTVFRRFLHCAVRCSGKILYRHTGTLYTVDSQ